MGVEFACKDFNARIVVDRVKVVMWSKGPRQISITGPIASPVKLNTRDMGLDWQLDLFSETCMGKELRLDIKVPSLTL